MVVASVDDIVGVDAPHVSDLLELGFTIKRAMRMQIRARPSRLHSSNREVWIHTIVGAGTMDMMSAIRFNEKPYDRDPSDTVHHDRLTEHMQRVRVDLQREEWRSADKAVDSSQARVECAHDIFLLDYITALRPEETADTDSTHKMEEEPQADGAAAADNKAPAATNHLVRQPSAMVEAIARAHKPQPRNESVAALPLPADGPQPMEMVSPSSSVAAPTRRMPPPAKPTPAQPTPAQPAKPTPVAAQVAAPMYVC